MFYNRGKQDRTPRSLVFGMVLLFLLTAPAHAAEPLSLIVEGIEGEAMTNVRKALSFPYGLVQGGTVNELWLKRFVEQIPDGVRRALEPFGYYNAGVKTEINEISDARREIVVTIEPGSQVRIDGLSIAVRGPGREEPSLNAAVRNFSLKQGDILLHRRYEQAKGALRSGALESGYLDSYFSVHEIRVLPAESRATIDLRLETGPQYHFGPIRFEGAPQYPERFLERFVVFKPGDVFSYAKLGESQLNLVNSGRFKEVIPVPEKKESTNNSIPVLMRLQPAPTRHLRPGIGYATDIGPRFSLKYRDLNVFDRGHEFQTELSISDRLQNLGASYTLPDAKDINSFTGVQANLTKEDVTTYTNNIASAEINRTRSFRKGRLGTVYVKLQRERSTIGSERIDSRLVVPGVRFSERRYDDLVRPSRGRRYTIDLLGTDSALGSNTRFTQVIAEGNLLLPLPWRLSLLTRVRTGATFLNEAIGSIPVSYRFFAGGDRSVRGYAYQSLGPRDATGRVVGGKDILVMSIELERALFQNWGVAGFYDAGNAFNSYTEMHLFQGAGIGVRYHTVVGAVRLDLARQIAVAQPSYRLHITVGFEF